MSRDKIIKFCEDYLSVKDFVDYCHNGLEIEGQKEVTKIVGGVSLSLALIDRAISEKAQMIIVHHGIFGNQLGTPPVIKGYVKNRFKKLLENDINLAGFHLPLDAHPQIGNNVSLANLLQIKNLEKMDVGFFGELDEAMPFEEFLKLVDEKLNTKSIYIKAGPEKVKRVGIISGGASPDFVLASLSGCDTFLCGDIRESVVRAVEETGINFINAGHYNTEKLGIENLGRHIAKEFGVEFMFVDIPCDI